MTSVITVSPLPSEIQRINVVKLDVACTLHPARVKACVKTVRMVRSSSAISTVPSICYAPFWVVAMGKDILKTVRPGTEFTEIHPP